MSKSTLAQSFQPTQAQEGYQLTSMSYHQLLDRIVHEYGMYRSNDISVDPYILTIGDKRLILSHILEADEYEWACHSPFRTELTYREHINYISKELQYIADQAHYDFMEESGLYAQRHRDNGETFWSRQ